MELEKVVTELGKAFDEFKTTNDKRLEALAAGRETEAKDLGDKLTKIDESLSTLTEKKAQIERDVAATKEMVEQLEADEKRLSTPEKKRHDEYANAFERFIRSGGGDQDAQGDMKRIHKEMLAAKDITIGDGPSGGFAVPKVIAREIERLEKKFSPVRTLVKVVRVSTSDYQELVNIRGTTAGWVGETDTRTATATSKLRERKPTHGELYAYPQASEWSLDDMAFDVQQWIAEEVGEEFAIEEGDAVIRGNGTNKPTGMLNTAPVATADFASPLRNANAYQYVPLLAGSPAALSADGFLDLVYAVNSRYRIDSTWVMNSVMTGVVRKLKDNDGQYLWAPGLQAGEPDRFLGYPTQTWEQLDDPSANNFPVGFGNFRRGYLLVDRVGMRITRDEVTNPGFIRWYIRRREGGIVLNNDAVKWGRYAAS